MSWLGVLGSGLATAAGIASGNDYLVAGGAGAAGSYANSYDQLTTSLIEEQKQVRLADALMERQKHYALWQRDELNKEQREYDRARQEKFDALGIKQGEAAIRASDSTVQLNDRKMTLDEKQFSRQGALLGLQMQEAQLSIDERKRRQDPEYRKKLAMEEVQLKGDIAREVAKVQRAASSDELAFQMQQVNKVYGEGTPQAQMMNSMLQLKAAGVDTSMFFNKSAKPPSDETLQKVGESSGELEANSKDTAAMLQSDDPNMVAEGQRRVERAKQVGIMNFTNIYNQVAGGGGVGLPVPSPQRELNIESMVKDLSDGAVTAEQLKTAAKGDAEAEKKVALAIQQAGNGGADTNIQRRSPGKRVAQPDSRINSADTATALAGPSFSPDTRSAKQFTKKDFEHNFVKTMDPRYYRDTYSKMSEKQKKALIDEKWKEAYMRENL